MEMASPEEACTDVVHGREGLVTVFVTVPTWYDRVEMVPSPVFSALKTMVISEGAVSVFARLQVMVVVFLQVVKPAMITAAKRERRINFFMGLLFDLYLLCVVCALLLKLSNVKLLSLNKEP